MVRVYEQARDEAGYNATLFLRMITEQGGLATARQLQRSSVASDGFTALWERGRPEEDVPLLLPPGLSGNDDEAIELLRSYFGLRPGQARLTGAFFERLGGGGDRPEVCDRITAEDIVAVSLLSVNIDPSAMLQILGSLQAEVSELLRQIPTDRDLVDVDPQEISPNWPARQLWDRLRGCHGMGPVKTSKLMARKRPRLLPIYDEIVRQQLGLASANGYWSLLACELRKNDGALHAQLLTLRDRAGIGADISALRVFDIVTWMTGRQTVN
jgi:hypothetical protein